MLPYLKLFVIVHNILRILLLITSFKYRRVVHVAIYFESINVFFEAIFPTKTELSRDATLQLVGSYLVFTMSYFHFLPSVIVV